MPGCRETRVHTHGTGGVYVPEDVMSIFEGQPKVWLCSLGSSHCECRAALERLTRELQVAREEKALADGEWRVVSDERDRLRALLQEIYDNGYDWSASQRRDIDARIKAALEG